MALVHEASSDWRPTRVVVLGASGFVASAVLSRLEKQKTDVLGLARTALDLTADGAGSTLAGLLRSDDSLLFVSAKAPVKDSGMLLDNIRMGAAVCDALRAQPVAHVVYISSDAVYADSDTPLTESSCAQPGSLHGVMHLAREVMLADAYKGPLCFLRPTLIYGANDPHNGYGPNRFARLAVQGQAISLFGGGEERRDHVFIDDVAELVVRVLYHRACGELNVATGYVHSFSEIAKRARSLAGSNAPIDSVPRSGPMPHKGYRPFDSAETHRAFPDFRYTTLEEGLAQMLRDLQGRGLHG